MMYVSLKVKVYEQTNEGCLTSSQETSLYPLLCVVVLGFIVVVVVGLVVGAIVVVVMRTHFEPVQIPQVLLQFMFMKLLYLFSKHLPFSLYPRQKLFKNIQLSGQNLVTSLQFMIKCYKSSTTYEGCFASLQGTKTKPLLLLVVVVVIILGAVVGGKIVIQVGFVQKPQVLLQFFFIKSLKFCWKHLPCFR